MQKATVFAQNISDCAIFYLFKYRFSRFSVMKMCYRFVCVQTVACCRRVSYLP